jgi:hypothetical protein
LLREMTRQDEKSSIEFLGYNVFRSGVKVLASWFETHGFAALLTMRKVALNAKLLL